MTSGWGWGMHRWRRGWLERTVDGSPAVTRQVAERAGIEPGRWWELLGSPLDGSKFHGERELQSAATQDTACSQEDGGLT